MIGTTLLDRYALHSELGTGSSGIVYLSHDRVLDRRVAIKIVREPTPSPKERDRFRREARITAALDHPSIAPIYDFGQQGDDLFIVMPYLAGETLRAVIDRGPLTPTAALDVAIQIAGALDHSHARGVVHRDVKPENVMVDWQAGHPPQTKVVDFGLATLRDDRRLGARGSVYGTVLYIPPEQLLGEPIDHRADLYALGMVLYECLTGLHPLRDGGRVIERILTHDPPSLREQGVDLPDQLDRMVLRCLAKEAEARPGRARDVLRNLIDARRAIDGDLPSTAVPATDGRISGERMAASRGSTEGTTTEAPVTATDRLGDLLTVQSAYLEAQDAYLQARADRRAQGVLAAQTECTYLAKLAGLAMRLGRYREALERCGKGLELVVDDDPACATVMAALAGLVCTTQGDLDQAAFWLDRSGAHLDRARGGTDDLTQAQLAFLRTQGNLLMAQGRAREAVRVFTRTVEQWELLDDRWERSIALFNLGEARLLAGDRVGAIEVLDRARREKSALGDRWGLAYVHHALARVHSGRRDFDQALRAVAEGKRLATEVAAPKIASRLAILEGDIHAATGKPAAALRSFEEALDLAERIAAHSEVADARARLAGAGMSF